MHKFDKYFYNEIINHKFQYTTQNLCEKVDS